MTSPILPSNRQAVSHGIGPPGLCQSDIHISHNLSAAESDCSLFFEKEKPSNETCALLEDCEAEAAASAVAVAAISSDEIGGNVLGAGHVSVSDSKIFGGADLDSISAGTHFFYCCNICWEPHISFPFSIFKLFLLIFCRCFR